MGRGGRRPPAPEPAPGSGAGDWRVRVIQPYQAVKHYRCPGCDHEILPRTLHVVAWPDSDPDLRRHWHRPCWERHRTERARVAGRRPPP